MAKKSTYEKEMQALDALRTSALEQGDYRSYAYLCDELGVQPEDEFAYERGSMESEMERKGDLGVEEEVGGLEKAVRKAVVDAKVANGSGKRKRTLKPGLAVKYKVLYEAAMEVGVNPDNVFEDTETKKRLLREYMEYTKLIVGKGERVFLDDAKNTRIGSVFRDCFYRGRDVYIQEGD